MAHHTCAQLAQLLNARLEGSGSNVVTTPCELDRPVPGGITYIGDKSYAPRFITSPATAALVSSAFPVPHRADQALIVVSEPAQVDLAMARVLELYAPPALGVPPGVHPGAVVDASATLGAGVAVGPLAYVGPGVVMGEGCVLHAHAVVHEGSVLGAGCVIHSHAVVRERCVLGQRVIVHAGAVIGGDGFGYRPSADGRGIVKIPHLAGVELGDDVEVGCNTTIDRGKFSPTRIGRMTKLDNLCQIGHNCELGVGCLLAGQVGIAGSTVVGNGVMIGGGASLKDHLKIGDGAKIAARAALMHDVPAGESWAGYPAVDIKSFFRQVAATRRLPELVKQLKQQ